MACAAALGGAGFRVRLLEARPFLGGRATSYPLANSGERIDNCQHVLLRCCRNLLDFYDRLGVQSKIRFHREIHFLEPGGRLSVLGAGRLPPPLHFAGAFAGLHFLDWRDKWGIVRALAALGRERRRADLDRISMLDWLGEKGQTRRAIERFWRQILVSAVNEEVSGMSALHGVQVLWLGFLASRDGHELGIPSVPLSELYNSGVWARQGNVSVELRMPVERLEFEPGRVRCALAAGGEQEADYYVCCVPFERLVALAPELGFEAAAWGHSPITGIHLWFDRRVTELPHATLLDRTIQWFFDKEGGRYLQVVVSASRSLLALGRAEVVELAVRELGEFLPRVREARLEKAHVVKEVRATFSARPGLEALRPCPATRFPNLFLAGDWTRTGWPPTMEGAVRSGYLAAEAVAAAAGAPMRFLVRP